MTAPKSPEELWAKRTEGFDDGNVDAESTLPTEPRGSQSLARLIRAYTNLHRAPAADVRRPVQFVWGHLDVLARLGSGSFGEVFCAFDKVLERDVALKLRSSKEVSARAYIAEARRLARVRHPHVLAVHGAAVHDGRVGLWADLIDGMTLREWIATNGAATRDQVLSAASMLASALQAVHRAGLIHGDVKPGNIMRDGAGELVLMDFGTASEHSADGVRMSSGTLLVMAPEQLQGARVTPAIDIYALGVVLYFMVCGDYPVRAETLEGLSRVRMAGDQTDFRRLKDRCGRALSGLIATMMAADPGSRPDATAVVAATQAILQAPARRRKRLAVAAVVGGLSLALAVSLAALVRIDAERQFTAKAEARESNVRGFMRDFLVSPQSDAGNPEARVIDVLDEASRLAEQRFLEQPLALAEVLRDLGESFHGIGAIQQAQPLLARALVLGRENGMSPDQLLRLELDLQYMSDVQLGGEADPTRLQAILDRAQRKLGDTHDVSLEAAFKLATLYLKKSDVQKAEASLRDVLAKRPFEQFPANQLRLRAQSHLVTLFAEQGRWEEADVMLQQALAAIRENQLEQAGIGFYLRSAEAELASRRGRYAQAEAIYQVMIPEIEDVLGTRHSVYRASLNGLAISQRRQGKYSEAIQTLRRLLTLLHEARRGEDHVSVLVVQDNLASALADNGEREEARRLREKTLQGKQRTLGAIHPGTLNSQINLAEQLIEDGDAALGLTLADAAVLASTDALGAGDLITLEAREMRARARLALGEHAPARAELEAVHAAKRAAFGDEFLYTLRSSGFLASALVAEGKRDAARALLDQSIAELSAQFDDGQSDLQRQRAQRAKL